MESIEFKKLIPEHIDIIFDGKGRPLCSRQAIANLIQEERKEAIVSKIDFIANAVARLKENECQNSGRNWLDVYNSLK